MGWIQACYDNQRMTKIILIVPVPFRLFPIVIIISALTFGTSGTFFYCFVLMYDDGLLLEVYADITLDSLGSDK